MFNSVPAYILSSEEALNSWVVSDPHFDHLNIIEYSQRPFCDVEHMNRTILDNWHQCIHKDDLVFFLGDMCFGRNSRSAKWWLEQLSGRIVYVKGSHDHGIRSTSVGSNVLCVVDMCIAVVDGTSLLLSHEPYVRFSNRWKGWIVHGHIHNRLPHLIPQYKQINVSLDVTDFKPVTMHHVLDAIRSAEGKLDC